ncbi:MAG: HEAT repeat domain-containing protein [Thermodesulfobacteriota bacterium]
MGAAAAGAVFLCLLAAPAAAASTARLRAELGLRAAEAGRDRGALEALAAGAGPGAVRGQALWALYRGVPAPLSAKDRVLLVAALRDPAPEVRQAALRCVGAAGDRALEREALARAAEDPDTEVRIEALRAVRPWARHGQVYFLEQALAAEQPRVRAEAVRNLAQVAYREVPHELFGRVAQWASGADPDFGVRAEALDALGRWGRLEWGHVEAALGQREAPESFRLRALALGDGLPRPEGRSATLLDLLATDPSLRITWEAYRRLSRSGAGESDLAPALARLLPRLPENNAATGEMAAYLRARGYRAEYRSGTWHVSGR